MKDLSRNEELLDALLNETELPEIKPKSRMEAYLHALCEKGLITANELKEINRILDSDDENLDQLSEIVAYIKKNRELTNQLSEEIAEPVSWNDLEDKPFYEHTEEKTILPTTSCNAFYCGKHYGCDVNSEDGLNSFLEEGKVYKVVFDGVEYVRTAEVVNNIVVLGNKKYSYNIIFGSNTNEDTGEPFFIANYDNGSLGLKIRVEYEESFAISISSEDLVLKQLDEKYIPDNTFMITLIDNGDGTYDTNKTYEEIIEAYVNDKKDLILDCLCMGIPYPCSLPFVGLFGGGFQFGYLGDNTNSTDYILPIFVGVTVTLHGVETYIKDLMITDIQLLKTTDKTITGAINELKAEIDALKAQNQ